MASRQAEHLRGQSGCGRHVTQSGSHRLGGLHSGTALWTGEVDRVSGSLHFSNCDQQSSHSGSETGTGDLPVLRPSGGEEVQGPVETDDPSGGAVHRSFSGTCVALSFCAHSPFRFTSRDVPQKTPTGAALAGIAHATAGDPAIEVDPMVEADLANRNRSAFVSEVWSGASQTWSRIWTGLGLARAPAASVGHI